MHHILQTSKFTPLIHAAQAALGLLDSGAAFADTPEKTAECIAVTNRLQQSLNSAIVAVADAAQDGSPFLRHRSVILGRYATAERLQALVLSLYNSHNKVDLARLLRNADERHQRIALELMASYAEHGENDRHFMNLADEIRDLQPVAA